MSSIKCPKCGSGNVIGYMGEWECMNCGHKFTPGIQITPVPSRVRPEAPPPVYKKTETSKGVWIGAIIATLIIGLIFGYTIGYGGARVQTITQTITQALATSIITTTVREEVTVTETHTVTVMTSPTYTVPTKEGTTVRIGEPLSIGVWEILVISVKEAAYIKYDDSYYKPKEGMKVVIINLKFTNKGKEVERTSDIWQFVLVTDKGRSYEDTSIGSLEYISTWEVTPEIEEHAIAFEPTLFGQDIAPNTYAEEQKLFQFPADEKPSMIYFKVGIFSPKTVTVLIE